MILYRYFEKLVVGNRLIVTGRSLCGICNEITLTFLLAHRMQFIAETRKTFPIAELGYRIAVRRAMPSGAHFLRSKP